jgi:hypothetical protein
MVIWISAGLIWEGFYKLGRWDEALQRCASLLADVERLGGHYMEAQLRLGRACILAARGHDAEARAEVDASIALLDTNPDAQFQGAISIYGAIVLDLLGDRERGAELLERLAEVDSVLSHRTAGFAPPFPADLAAAALHCGFAERFLGLWADAVPHRRLEAGRLIWTGRALEAADLYAYASPQEESVARLVAAEQLVAEGRTTEAAAQLERGLAFYRAVGAHKVVAEAEALLATAS